MPSKIAPIAVTAWTATSAVGSGRAAMLEAATRSRSGLRPNDFTHQPLPTWIGRVAGLEEAPLPSSLAAWDCRNHRLAWQGLQADGFLDAVARARERFGAARVAVVLGTSTSSIGARQRQQTVHEQRQAVRFLEHASDDLPVRGLVASSTKADFADTANRS